MHEKADYALSQGQIRDHECHWPSCSRQVPPAMFMCKVHWFKLPKDIRDAIWAAYRPGQEIDMNFSDAYAVAAEKAQEWIRQQEAR